MNKLFWILKSKTPFYGKRFMKKEAQKEKKEGLESTKYTKEQFNDFLMGLPEYCIRSDFLSTMIRNSMKTIGVKYTQYVFIDKGNSEDHTAWIRTEKDYIVHKKGTYFTPWESNKKIIYFDIIDSRPLIDKTKEMNWYNQDMCADVITAVTNSKSMNSLRGNETPQWLIYMILGISGLTLLLVFVDLYTLNNVKTEIISYLSNIVKEYGNVIK